MEIKLRGFILNAVVRFVFFFEFFPAFFYFNVFLFFLLGGGPKNHAVKGVARSHWEKRCDPEIVIRL